MGSNIGAESNIGVHVAENSVSIIESLCSDNQLFNQLASTSNYDNLENDATNTDSTPASDTETEIANSDSYYCPTPLKKSCVSRVDLGNSVFVCQTTQLQQFIDQINQTSECYTENCTGKLVPLM